MPLTAPAAAQPLRIRTPAIRCERGPMLAVVMAPDTARSKVCASWPRSSDTAAAAPTALHSAWPCTGGGMTWKLMAQRVTSS